MSGAYINRPFNLGVGETLVIPLNRWSTDDYTLQVDTGGTVALEGTLDRINRGETPTWATVSDKAGAPISAAPVGLTVIDETPLEAVRLTAAAATCTGRFMQQGHG